MDEFNIVNDTYSPSERSEILEDIYLKTLEALPDAVLIVNENGKIVVFNKEAELLFGYHRSEIIGEPVEILIPDNVRMPHVIERLKYMEQPRIHRMGMNRLVNGLHRSGRLIPVEVKLSPMVIAKAGIHILAVIKLIQSNIKIHKIEQMSKDIISITNEIKEEIELRETQND